MLKLRPIVLLTFVMLSAVGAIADDLADMRRACIERANLRTGVHWMEECFQELFTAQPLHIAISPVAPGAGIVGLGPGLGFRPRVGSFEFILLGKGIVSNDGSNLQELQMTFALPAKGIRLPDASRLPDQRYSPYEVGRNPTYRAADSKISVTLGAQRLAAREQDFFGLGHNSTLAGHATYGLISTSWYGEINDPLTTWNAVGLQVSFITPRVTSSINNSVAQMRSAYTTAEAPGLNSRDDFLHYEPYMVFHLPPHRTLSTDVRIGYAFYQDTSSTQLSFQRFTGSSKTTIPLWLPAHGTPSNRHWYANIACPTLRSATRCSIGTLTLSGWVTASYTGGSSQVPFYFDPTLGGTDMLGNDTLRGFVDYRFRGPSALLLQAEYRRPVWGPIGLLSFYDTGKVALRPADITFSQLRHDIGVGFYLRAGNNGIVRFYVGFGTGEPSQFKAKFPISF